MAVSPSQLQHTVLHVITGLGLGGAETMLYRLLQVSSSDPTIRHRVLSLTSGSNYDFRSIGVDVTFVDLKSFSNPFRALAALQTEIHRIKPDIVHSWLYHANIASALVVPRRTPLVWGIHHALHDLAAEKPMLRLLILAGTFLSYFRSIKKIIFVSAASREQHLKRGYAKDKALVLANGFDTDKFMPNAQLRSSVRNRLGLRDENFVIGNFGRFHPIKDHHLLLHSFSLLVKEIPTARLLLAGTEIDSGNQNLMKLINALELKNHVLLLGPRDDVADLYNALDAYSLSSKSESLPNVIGEACATAVPCITTDVGDARLLAGNTALIVKCGDVDALFAAMRVLAMSKKDELIARGMEARNHIVQNYGIAKTVERHRSLYCQLTNEVSV